MTNRKAYTVGTTCQNCGESIYRKQFPEGGHGEWAHAGGSKMCKPKYAKPPEYWRD